MRAGFFGASALAAGVRWNQPDRNQYDFISELLWVAVKRVTPRQFQRNMLW
jgi:hypothetical protein